MNDLNTSWEKLVDPDSGAETVSEATEVSDPILERARAMGVSEDSINEAASRVAVLPEKLEAELHAEAEATAKDLFNNDFADIVEKIELFKLGQQEQFLGEISPDGEISGHYTSLIADLLGVEHFCDWVEQEVFEVDNEGLISTSIREGDIAVGAITGILRETRLSVADPANPNEPIKTGRQTHLSSQSLIQPVE